MFQNVCCNVEPVFQVHLEITSLDGGTALSGLEKLKPNTLQFVLSFPILVCKMEAIKAFTLVLVCLLVVAL